jgi:hypothetical protein
MRRGEAGAEPGPPAGGRPVVLLSRDGSLWFGPRVAPGAEESPSPAPNADTHPGR